LHQRIDGLRGEAVGFIGEVGIDRGRAGRVVAQILLDMAQIDPALEQVRGVGVPLMSSTR
jgi:hypothetical protein